MAGSSATPLAPITMHEMKIETSRILEPALSPYHTGESCSKLDKTIGGGVIPICLSTSKLILSASWENVKQSHFVLLPY